MLNFEAAILNSPHPKKKKETFIQDIPKIVPGVGIFLNELVLRRALYMLMMLLLNTVDQPEP